MRKIPNFVDWSIYFDYGQINGHHGQIKHYNGQIIIRIGQIIKSALASGITKADDLMLKYCKKGMLKILIIEFA
ncbi:hypothetical protein [Bacillus pakistanensis]|uniref:hypothetical protein n=1 Tax=Rossellomorea pakistanensis TaxID=992288 RepID=UPI0019667A4B|nr:hypothetical protein [Bacillus pakistanensis]